MSCGEVRRPPCGYFAVTRSFQPKEGWIPENPFQASAVMGSLSLNDPCGPGMLRRDRTWPPHPTPKLLGATENWLQPLKHGTGPHRAASACHLPPAVSFVGGSCEMQPGMQQTRSWQQGILETRHLEKEITPERHKLPLQREGPRPRVGGGGRTWPVG